MKIFHVFNNFSTSPMIIPAPARCGHCSYSKELLDLLLVLDTNPNPDGRALCKGIVKASNLH